MSIAKVMKWFPLLLINILTLSSISAQNNPYNEVSIASPTAGSLAKYADIPVSYHTGLPQVTIPIYEAKHGTLTLPITLTYHASGLKVMEASSWVGAGWSLNAGGVITRTVQGAPDERMTSTVSPQAHGHLSESGYNNYLWVNGPPPFLNSPNWAFPEKQDWLEFAEGRKDGEPDLYFFNVAGYAGKFYFHDDGSPVLVPQQDVRIQTNYTPGVGSSISSFILTVPNGTRYYFGRTDNTLDVDPVEKTHPFNGDNLYVGQALSSWFLNKIESADAQFSISLSYASENYSYYTFSTFPIDANSNVYEYKAVKNIVSGVRLSQINFVNGTVDFTPGTNRRDVNGNFLGFTDDVNTEAKPLASISIYNTGGINCKKFNFTYSYFEDNSSQLPPGLGITGVTTDKKRLKLNSVQEQTCDGQNIIPPYSFEYLTEFVPRRMSFAQDHWGYYNAANSNIKLIPTYTVDEFTQVIGANRDANWPAMGVGSLKKIIYPTGGSTLFDLEANDTWVNYTKKQWTLAFSIGAGFGGSSDWVISTRTFSGATYKLNFTNSPIGSQALLNIYRVSDNVLMGGWVLEPGQNYVTNLNYAAGDYRIELRKLAAQNGSAATASFDEWTTSVVQKNETVGGLRIKTITQNDAVLAQNNIVTTYSYTANNKTTGVLYSRPSYVYKIRNDIVRDIGYQDGPACNFYGCIDCNGSAFVKSGGGIRPMETTQGNHIGYNEVKVTQVGKGYSIYRFYGSNIWDLNFNDVAYRDIITNNGCEPTITNFPFAPLPNEFKRGEMKYEGHFDESGFALTETEYFPLYQDNPVKTPALIVGYIPNSSIQSIAATFYELNTAKKTQVEVIHREKSNGSGVLQSSSTSYFESPYHNQVTRQTKTSSTGETIETKFKYSTDFRIPTCDAISTCVNEYETAIAAAQVLYDSLKSSPTHLYRWWAWQKYIKDKSLARINYVNCRKANYSGNDNAYKTCIQNFKNNSADSWLKPILELQERFMLTPIEESNWRAGKLLNARFNKYEYAVSPGSMVYPAKEMRINVAIPSATFTPAAVSSNTITKDTRYADETSAKFENGNLVEIKNKSGVTTSYIWGYNNSFPIVKAVGTNYAALKSAYDAVSGNLTNLRSQPSLVSAFISIYEYNTLLGLTSESDANGRKVFYEYDALWRLKFIRDQDGNIVKKFDYQYQQPQ